MSDAALDRLRADAAINGRRENPDDPHDPSWALPGWTDVRLLLGEIDRLREALTYYAERRNHTTMHDGTPHLWSNDAFDDAGPGTRARLALGGDRG